MAWSHKVYLWRTDEDLFRGEGFSRAERPHRTIIGRSGQTPSRGSVVLFLGRSEGGQSSLFAVGQVRGKQSVSTARQRLVVRPFHVLGIPITLSELSSRVDRHVVSAIDEAWNWGPLDAKLITPRSQPLLLAAIAEVTSEVTDFIATIDVNSTVDLSNPERLAEAHDATSIAMRLAGVESAGVGGLELDDRSPSGGAIDPSFFVTDLEDDMLAEDLRRFDEGSVIRKIASSATLVKNHQTRLLVVNVNRKKLEHVHGVDLVYYDLNRETATVVQYKRLSRGSANDWTYTNKSELEKQIALMDLDGREPATSIHEWRISPSPHFFKFMKSTDFDASQNVLPGMYVSADYLRLGIDSKEFFCGLRGGFQISYNNCSYLPTGPFIELVSRGFVGTSSGDKSDLLNAVKTLAQSDQVILALRAEIVDQ